MANALGVVEDRHLRGSRVREQAFDLTQRRTNPRFVACFHSGARVFEHRPSDEFDVARESRRRHGFFGGFDVILSVVSVGKADRGRLHAGDFGRVA